MDQALKAPRPGRIRSLLLRMMSALNRLAPLNHRLWPFVQRLLEPGNHVTFRYHGLQQLVIPRAWLNRYSTTLLLHGSAASNPEFALMGRLLPGVLAGRPGHAFIDVGAGIGATVAWMRSRFSNAIRAYEPAPPTRAALRLSCEANRWSDVLIVPKALGAHAGVTTLDVRPNSVLLPPGARPMEGTVEVPLATLDAETADGPPIGFIKIDVEGYETEVLMGAARLIARDRPVLWIEAHPRLLAAHGASLAEFVDLLEARLGYDLRFLFWPAGRSMAAVARIARHYRPAPVRSAGSPRDLPPANELPEQVFVLALPR